MMKRMASQGWGGTFQFSPQMMLMVQRHLPIVIAVLFVLSASAAVTAVLAPGLTALIFLGGATAVGLIVVYGFATGALAQTAPPMLGDITMRVIEDVPEAYLITRRDGSVVYANTAYRQLTAFLGGERMVSFERLLAGQDAAAQPVYKLARAARDGEEIREELPVLVPGGGRTWLRVEVRPLVGQAHHILWRIIDKGPEREAGAARNALRVERDGLIRALDHLPTGLLTLDEHNTLLYANRTASSLTGLAPESMAGARLDQLFSGRLEIIAERLRQAAHEGEPVELALRQHDGAHESSLRVFVRVCTDLGPDALPVTHVTIWPRKAEAAADDELPANSLVEFLEHAPIGILILDDEGRIALTNPVVRALFAETGRDAEAVEDLIDPEDRDALSDLVQQLRDDRSDRDGIEVRLAGGTEKGAARAVQIFVSRLDPVPGGSGHLIFYFVDKTQQKSLEQQFAQSQKMQAIGQLAGGIAHDFNNLLTAIIGFCDLLAARHPAGDPSFADVEQIKQNALRAANLTRQLLAFSRRQTLVPKILSLTDVLADLSMLMRRLIGERIQLDIQHGRDLGLVKVDQGQLEQVLINLVVNARDAMADGGTLQITTGNVTAAEIASRTSHSRSDQRSVPEGDYVEIAVKDTGCGIPEGNLDRIFEPFFTTKNDETVGKGTGLGLSTVYGIVQQTGGFIFVDSKVGEGTTFRIYLPLEARAGDAKQERAKKESTKTQDLTGAETVLIVEDEDAVRMFASRALQSRGYTVIEASSGEHALEIVEEHEGPINLVVSDVIMPGMDGPTMVNQLRGTLTDAKIIFMSGYAESTFQSSLEGESNFHFLPKPFTLKQLAQTVKDVLEE